MFEKGKSGNPGGRPKGSDEVKRLAREHTVEAIQRLVELMRGDNPSVSVSACNAILDRGWGKPNQTADVHVFNYDVAVSELLNGSTVETGDAASTPETIN